MIADTLAALARAWLDGQPGAGPALHDALEESGWPLEWCYRVGQWQ